MGDVQGQDEIFKNIPVFGLFNGVAVGADNGHATAGQRLGQVHSGLAPQGHNDPLGLFVLHHVHDALNGQGLKIELVRSGIVSRDGFRVVVDDNGLVAGIADGPQGVNRGVVELHALADADGAGAQHNDFFPVGDHGFLLLLIGGVEIGHIALKLPGAGVDHLINGENMRLFPQGEEVVLGHVPELGQILVGEAHALGFLQQGQIPGVGFQFLFKVHDLLDLVQEHHVNLGDVADTGVVYSQPHELGNGIDPVVGALLDVFQKLVHRHVLPVKLVGVDVAHAGFQGLDSFQEALLKGAAHGHDLAGGLHLGGEGVGAVFKFIKGETGNLGDHIVQGRLKAGRGVDELDFIQAHAHGDFGGNPGNGVAGGLGGQGRGAGNAGVDLNDIVLEGLGVQGKLDVAPALDFQRPDNPQGAVPEHMVFLVGQGLAGGHHNGVAGVDAHRVHVLHVADGDGRVVGVPHDLVFDFLIALDALFNEHLVDRGQGQGVLHHFGQLFVVVGEAAAGAAQGEGRAQDYRVADFVGGLQGLLHAEGDFRGHHRLANAQAQLLEQIPVLGFLNALGVGAQQLDAALLQHAFFGQLHGQVQAGLASQAGDNGVGAFVAADAGQVFQGQGLHIHLVGNGGVRHNGGGVGVHQHHLIAFFPQGQTGLGAGIVEFRSLSDDNGPGADDHNLVQISSLWHGRPPPSD